VVETYPSEKSWSEFVSWEYVIPNFSWKVMKNSMVPVTTNQKGYPLVNIQKTMENHHFE
jgi:hypothetical protein